MEKFTTHTGIVAPLQRSAVDTDQIIPAVYLKRVTKTGFEDALFANWRQDPEFVLNQDAFRSASVLVAGPDFGTGSSREHAAMCPRFLGAKAVVVRSFARIHETNLKKQGVLGLVFNDPADYDKVQEDDRVAITGLADLAPGKSMKLTLTHKDGSTESFDVSHTLTDEQIEWYRAGSALNRIAEQQKAS